MKTVRVPVPPGHWMVHVVLEDGRELWSSPGHRTVDARSIGDLRVGDFLSSGRILWIEEVAYRQSATYDILPSGPTGSYWANGILLGSILANTDQEGAQPPEMKRGPEKPPFAATRRCRLF